MTVPLWVGRQSISLRGWHRVLRKKAVFFRNSTWRVCLNLAGERLSGESWR